MLVKSVFRCGWLLSRVCLIIPQVEPDFCLITVLSQFWFFQPLDHEILVFFFPACVSGTDSSSEYDSSEYESYEEPPRNVGRFFSEPTRCVFFHMGKMNANDPWLAFSWGSCFQKMSGDKNSPEWSTSSFGIGESGCWGLLLRMWISIFWSGHSHRMIFGQLTGGYNMVWQ